jgi:hypothetical protein
VRWLRANAGRLQINPDRIRPPHTPTPLHV